jgi:hypothetical protein
MVFKIVFFFTGFYTFKRTLALMVEDSGDLLVYLYE